MACIGPAEAHKHGKKWDGGNYYLCVKKVGNCPPPAGWYYTAHHGDYNGKEFRPHGAISCKSGCSLDSHCDTANNEVCAAWALNKADKASNYHCTQKT